MITTCLFVVMIGKLCLPSLGIVFTHCGIGTHACVNKVAHLFPSKSLIAWNSADSVSVGTRYKHISSKYRNFIQNHNLVNTVCKLPAFLFRPPTIKQMDGAMLHCTHMTSLPSEIKWRRFASDMLKSIFVRSARAKPLFKQWWPR